MRKVDNRLTAKRIVSQGWRATWTALFGEDFVNILAPHHIEAIEWHFEARLSFLEKRHPEYLAFFPIWARGNAKSSIAERMVVVDGFMSYAYQEPAYCLYLSRNKDKVQEHIANIEALLSLPTVQKVCSALSRPQRTEITNQQRRWTSSFLKTDADVSIQGGTLDSGLAGSRVGETRVTLLVPDDVDGREDSPVIAESRFRQLTTEILPMRQDNTLVFFAQNLISRFSVMYRIHTGQARVLTNRKPTEPVPAVFDLKTEQRTVGGIVKDVYVSGTPSWHVWDIQRIQDEIDTEGLQSFLREAQHEVEESREGIILYNYDDNVHVISESEFNNVYGKDSWLWWRKKPGNDWARTKTDKHANVAGWLTVSPSDSPLPNATFLIHPMSFPANSAPEDVAERLLRSLSPFAYKNVTWSELRRDVLRRANSQDHTKTVADKIAYEHGELSKIVPQYARPLLQRCNVQAGEMSHEQDTVRNIYSQVYGIGMRATNPKKHGGIEAINRAMRVDYTEDHPFRNQKGYTTWFMVVPDDKDKGEYLPGIYHPRPYPLAFQTNDLVDSDLWRFQISNWRTRPPILTAAGEVIDEPEKLYDDAPNLMQMWYTGAPLTGTRLTIDQQVQLIIPAETKERLKTAETVGEKLGAAIDYEFQESIARRQLGAEEEVFDLWR